MHLLTQLYTINSKSGREDEIRSFVISSIKDLNLQIQTDDLGNVFITKGISDSYPCIAAHLDEVHEPCTRNIMVSGDKIYALDEHLQEQVGIGADDKNGVWIAIRLLEQMEVLKVAFFVREEKGTAADYRHGSDDCDLNFFNDVRYVLQCDRKEKGDWVTFNTKHQIRLCEDDFIPEVILRQYGYAPVEGGVTDVVHLKQRGLTIPCCNISCGYHNAHKADEYTLFSELINSLSFVKKIVETI